MDVGAAIKEGVGYAWGVLPHLLISTKLMEIVGVHCKWRVVPVDRLQTQGVGYPKMYYDIGG
eukprot:759637-Hanusia_phi.AAC.2